LLPGTPFFSYIIDNSGNTDEEKMPSIIAPVSSPPPRKFFSKITSTKSHTRHFMSNGISTNNIIPTTAKENYASNNNLFNGIPTFSKMTSSTASSLQFHPSNLTLSENSKFLICCLMWYISSSLSSNTGKQIMNSFKYPVTLTFIQFLFVACWSAITEKLFNKHNIKKPTKIIIQTIVPLSLFMIVGHVFSSIAISRIPVSLVHTIKVS
jgi:hypothetical protein